MEEIRLDWYKGLGKITFFSDKHINLCMNAQFYVHDLCFFKLN
jgi:hypothetical protein